MTNIKITQEAREAAKAVIGQSAWDDIKQSHDSLSLVIAMQALINQTVERCAKVALKKIAEIEEGGDAKEDWAVAHHILHGIRTLKDN